MFVLWLLPVLVFFTDAYDVRSPLYCSGEL